MNRKLRHVGLTILTAICFNQAYAIGNGLYLGLMVGPATNANAGKEEQAYIETNTTMLLTTPVHARSNQIATRAYIGYQFSPYAAYELGFDFFSKIKYDTQGVTTAAEPSRRVRAADISLKGILPFYYFSAFAKLGVAMTYITTGGSFVATPISPPPQPYKPPFYEFVNTYTNKFSGLFAVGASYDINQSWVVDVTYTTLQVSGSIGNVSSLALGLSYHFTDKYCGQFLCDD